MAGDDFMKFVEACKNVGQNAVAVDKEFIRIKEYFDDLVKKYGKEFPKLVSDYAPRWGALKAHWDGNLDMGLLWSSREFAAKTAAILTDYGVVLDIVANIENEKDLKEAQDLLQEYIDSHPGKIGEVVANAFKNLKNDIEKFSEDFKKYIEEEGKGLSKEAEYYVADIKVDQTEIDSINKTIINVLIALGDYPAAFAIALMVDSALLIYYFNRRKISQERLDKAKAALEIAKKDQNPLAAMQVDLEILKPDFGGLDFAISTFAQIPAFTAEQAIQIKTLLDEGIEVIKTKKFQEKLELLRKEITPLKEGMREYATQIVAAN